MSQPTVRRTGCSGSVARPRRKRPLPRNRFDSGQKQSLRRLREAAQLVIGEPDPVAGGELRSQQPVFLVDLRVVVATGEVIVRCAHLGRVLGDVGVDPAVVVLLLQLPAAVHHLPCAAHSETRRDGVEIAALAVVALDEPLGLAVEFIRRDETVGANGRCRSDPQSRACYAEPPRRRTPPSRPGCWW